MPNRVSKRAGFLLLLAGIAGCSVAASAKQAAPVRQAVFKQQVSYWLADYARESGVVICLGTTEHGSVKGEVGSFLTDPRDRSAVRPVEACEALPGGAVERATSRPAVIITIVGISWQNPVKPSSKSSTSVALWCPAEGSSA